MKKIALIGVTMLTAISLAACSPSSNSGSKNSDKSTTESSNKPTLEIPESVVADSSKTAEITGKTTPNTKVKIGYGIGDKVTSDKDGNFTLKYELDEVNDQDIVEITAKNGGGKTTKEITIKQNPEVIKKKEADAKAKAEAEAKEKATADSKAKADAAAREKATADSKAKEDAARKAADEAAAREAAIPREYKDALSKGEDYISYTAFSKLGLKEQLLYEGYPDAAAQYAIDNIKTDWNIQALKKAQDYLSYDSFSDAGLREQLIYEQFTSTEADYAIANINK
ncbi:Ltp family lipoprotein [Lactococcus lactis]|uniref:Ltp family lipoprotein n=1 Tax=Lactococcus lactis TaxID=1358 RepID=UPI001897D792|nr:Ltp family lipoprotein [Lactococcus lactis]